MSWRDRIAQAVFFTHPTKPSAAPGPFPGPADADSSPRLGGPGGDGPTAPDTETGAVGHLEEFLSALSADVEDCKRVAAAAMAKLDVLAVCVNYAIAHRAEISAWLQEDYART
jgi:hypothetical protein